MNKNRAVWEKGRQGGKGEGEGPEKVRGSRGKRETGKEREGAGATRANALK